MPGLPEQGQDGLPRAPALNQIMADSFDKLA